MDNTYRLASRKYWDEMSKDLRPVYTAATEQAAKERLDEFAGKWGQQYSRSLALEERLIRVLVVSRL